MCDETQSMRLCVMVVSPRAFPLYDVQQQQCERRVPKLASRRKHVRHINSSGAANSPMQARLNGRSFPSLPSHHHNKSSSFPSFSRQPFFLA